MDRRAILDLYIADIGMKGQLENTQQIEGISIQLSMSLCGFYKDLKTVYFTATITKTEKNALIVKTQCV